jgi:hypothetical protein
LQSKSPLHSPFKQLNCKTLFCAETRFLVNSFPQAGAKVEESEKKCVSVTPKPSSGAIWISLHADVVFHAQQRAAGFRGMPTDQHLLTAWELVNKGIGLSHRLAGAVSPHPHDILSL